MIFLDFFSIYIIIIIIIIMDCCMPIDEMMSS
jgi:hypothetical protein